MCVLIKSRGLTINDGISYYGTLLVTIAPYCFGLVGSAYFCWRGTCQLNQDLLKPARYVLVAIAALTVGIVLTPYTLNAFVSDLHEAIGSTLFVLQLLLSGWFIVRLRYRLELIALTVLEFAAGVACLIWLNPKHGYLIEGQIVFQIAFGILLLYSLPLLLPVRASRATTS